MRIAAVQFYTDFDDTDKNWKRAETYMEKAAKEKADLVVFPEYFLCGSKTLFTKPLERFSALAIKYGLDMVTGTYAEKDPKDGKLYNCCSYVDKDGKVLMTYRKVHLWHPERAKFTSGTGFGTVTNRFGIKLGLCVCWDIAFNDCFSEMALNQGADLIVAPAFWTLDDAGKVGKAYDPNSERKLVDAMCTARAFENEIIMVFVNGAASSRSYQEELANPGGGGPVPPGEFGVLLGHTQIAVPFKGVIARCNHYFEDMLIQDIEIGSLTRDAEYVYKIRQDWAIKGHSKM